MEKLYCSVAIRTLMTYISTNQLQYQSVLEKLTPVKFKKVHDDDMDVRSLSKSSLCDKAIYCACQSRDNEPPTH